MSQQSTNSLRTTQQSPRANGSRRKKKMFVPSLLVRGLMISVLLSITVVVCGAVLSQVSRPYVIGAQQSSEIADKTNMLHQLDSENARLSDQCAYLSRPDGIEYEARLKGYLLPGERSLVITPAPTAGQ